MFNKVVNTFHVAIITLIFLTFIACGKKGDPIYVSQVKKVEIGA